MGFVAAAAAATTTRVSASQRSCSTVAARSGLLQRSSFVGAFAAHEQRSLRALTPRRASGVSTTIMTDFSLYVKAAEDGKSLGDCPFSHKTLLMAGAKKADFDLVPIDLSQKPDWYLEINKEGSVPTLKVGDKVIDDSEEVLQYLEKEYPQPPLLSDDKAASEAISGVMPAFAGLLQNKDESKEPEVRQKLDDVLTKLNDQLKHSKYVAGDNISSLDFNLAPKLYHIKHAAKYWKKYDMPAGLDALQAYEDRIFNSKLFNERIYSPDTVIWGWSKFFK